MWSKKVFGIFLAFTLFLSTYFNSLPLVSATVYTVENPSMQPETPGDVNLDGRVDGKDLAKIAKAYNTVPGDPYWNFWADLNWDKKVDGKDIAAASKFFGDYGPAVVTVAFSTKLNFTVPSDGDDEVHYYVMTRVYVPQALSGQKFYLFPEAVDDWILNVYIDGLFKHGGSVDDPPCQPPTSIDLGNLALGYHMLEFEFVEEWGGGTLQFNVATTNGEYLWLDRFRICVPNYSNTEYRYTVKTRTYLPGDDFFLGGYADDFIDDVYVDVGLMWQDWEWDMGPAYGEILAWGDGFMYPLGWQYSWHDVTFTFGEKDLAGVLDFQYVSRTYQQARIGKPKFYALAKIDNLGSSITVNKSNIYGGSQWAGNAGVSGRNVTTLAMYNVSYNDGNDWFNALLDVGIGNWWATWELGASQPPDVAIPLNFTVAEFTSNLWHGLILNTLYYWDIYLKDYTIDIYSLPNLPIKGIEEAGAGQSNGIIAPGYIIALDFAGTTIMTAGALIPGGLAIGSVVGLGVTGVAAVLYYAQGQQVSRYSETVKENNHWQLTANQPIDLNPYPNSGSSKSQSDLVFIKFQPNAAYHCGLTKVVLKGTLAARYNIVPTEGWPVSYDYSIGNIEIILCIPWFIWSLT